MTATIKDIAKKTGLSVGTISRYLNGYKLKKKNEELVSNAIKELDFKVNGYARFLKTNSSKIIGIVIPSIGLTFSAEIVNIIESKLAEHGYSVMITTINNSKQHNMDKLNNLELYNLIGVVVIPPADNIGLTNWLKNLSENIPVVVLDRLLDEYDRCTYVIVDNEKAVKHAVKHLIKNKHERIGFISGDAKGYTSVERKKGYYHSLNNFDIEVDEKLIVNSNYSKEGGYIATKKLMQLDKKPTAIFITNYDMTIGALKYLKEINCKVGKDLSVIGFDMDDLNLILDIELSMVVQPINDIANYAADVIIKAIENKISVKDNVKTFKCVFSSRESVIKINK